MYKVEIPVISCFVQPSFTTNVPTGPTRLQRLIGDFHSHVGTPSSLDGFYKGKSIRKNIWLVV